MRTLLRFYVATALAVLLGLNPAAHSATRALPPTVDPTYGLPLAHSHPHNVPVAAASWIWADTTSDNQTIYLRRRFDLTTVPASAVLFITADDFFTLFVNGTEVDRSVPDPNNGNVWQLVHRVNITSYLKAGANVLAIRAINAQGPAGVVAHLEIPGRAYIATNSAWKVFSEATIPDDWNAVGFNDSGWHTATVLAPVAGGVWAGAGGLQGWPGYDFTASYLAHLSLPAASILDVHPGAGRISGTTAAVGRRNAILTVTPAPTTSTDVPSLVLDFGKEVAGRIQIEPLTSGTVLVGTGESYEEATQAPWGGQHRLDLAPKTAAFTPYSAFRYARLQFPAPAVSPIRLRVFLDDKYYPVQYKGSFNCSDPLLTKIWYTGAYTAHLCMQEDIWDAPKRDRARWSGDLNVSGGVIDDVFADRFLMEQTLERLRSDAQGGRPADAPPADDVNQIPGYSAAWFCTVADLYRHVGDIGFVRREHVAILSLVQYDADEFDAKHLFVNPRGAWTFVDWSPGLDGDTPAAAATTDLFLIRGIREAAFLLQAIGDSSNSAKWTRWADTATTAARQAFADPISGTYGDRLQENAMAIYSGVATPAQTDAIYHKALDPKAGAWDDTGVPPYNDGVITPYYGNYVLRALSDAGETLPGEQLLRHYWGGMLAEGATTCWEAYDPYWPKQDFHANLYADGSHGYFVSLCHGWSSGPTAWLTECVLGVRPTSGGFRTAEVVPDLGDLQWAEGDVPTPGGLLHVRADKQPAEMTLHLTIPPGIDLRVGVPGARVLVNGHAGRITDRASGHCYLRINHPGSYVISGRS